MTVEYVTEGGDQRRMTSTALIRSSAESLQREFEQSGHKAFITEVIPQVQAVAS